MSVRLKLKATKFTQAHCYGWLKNSCRNALFRLLFSTRVAIIVAPTVFLRYAISTRNQPATRFQGLVILNHNKNVSDSIVSGGGNGGNLWEFMSTSIQGPA